MLTRFNGFRLVEVMVDGAYLSHAQGLMEEYTHEKPFDTSPHVATARALLGKK